MSVNSQKTAISLELIHFIDNIMLILISQVRNSRTHLTQVCILRFFSFFRATLEANKTYLVRIILGRRKLILVAANILNVYIYSRLFDLGQTQRVMSH